MIREEVLITRIPIIPNEVPVEFKKLQFPLRLSFAFTANRSQGQTLKIVGEELSVPFFAHAQSYAYALEYQIQKMYIY